MKLELTRKWKPRLFTELSSSAECGSIYLRCDHIRALSIWRGKASMGGIDRTGPRRRLIALARKDAEGLAVELLRDIRDGAKAIMDQYGMGEDD